MKSLHSKFDPRAEGVGTRLLTLFRSLHIPVTLFLDYNHLYIISQLAISPTLPTLLAPRALQVTKLDASTAWWIAIALYASSTVIWIIGIVVIREFWGGYLKIWRFGLGKRQVDLKTVYSSTAAFDRACMRSFSHFSFLSVPFSSHCWPKLISWSIRYRVRLSNLRKDANGRRHLPEALLESFSWYKQSESVEISHPLRADVFVADWPTAILLIPRAGVGLVALMLFQSAVYGSPTNRVGEKDSAYFAADGTLSSFASAVILTSVLVSLPACLLS